MSISKIGIVGCGLMGQGIAQVCAGYGFSTFVTDVNEEILDKGIKRIFAYIDKGIDKGKATVEERRAVEKNLRGVISLNELKGCGLIIEAAPEVLQIKTEIFRALNNKVPPECIFASNTSSLKIRELAEISGRKNNFIGLHFFNPVPVMNLVEAVKMEEMPQKIFDDILTFIKALGKTPIVCQDSTGFVVNRLLTPYLLDAVQAFEAGLASVNDIDTAVKLGLGYPMGPLALIDYVGVETVCHIAEIMFKEFKLEQYRPPALLKKMKDKGWLGKKSGMGFYVYQASGMMGNDEGLKEILNTENREQKTENKE